MGHQADAAGWSTRSRRRPPPIEFDEFDDHEFFVSSGYRWSSWYGPDKITCVEAARAYNLRPATIRQWIHRGHLTPIGRDGRQLLLDAREVNQVFHSPRRRTAMTLAAQMPSDGYYVEILASRVTSAQMDEVLSLPRVADITGLALPTIRSWYRRGHLRPVRTEGRTHLFRVGDVVAVARSTAGSRRRRFRRR